MGVYDLVAVRRDVGLARREPGRLEPRRRRRPGTGPRPVRRSESSQLFPRAAAVRQLGQRALRDQLAILDPQSILHLRNLDFSFVQPLLKGFGRPATEYGSRSPATRTRSRGHLFLQQVISTLQRVEDAYWRLVEARYQQRVAEESLPARSGAAPEQPDPRRRRHAGAARAGVERGRDRDARGGDHPRARRVGDAEDQMRWLLNLVDGDALGKRVVPETEASMAPVSIDLGPGARRPRWRRAPSSRSSARASAARRSTPRSIGRSSSRASTCGPPTASTASAATSSCATTTAR